MKTFLLIFWLRSLHCLLAIPAAIFWWAAAMQARLDTRIENLKANQQ